MAATRILVFGTMRSGTTMLCDLLTKPGQSLILNEPMLSVQWRGTDGREVKLTNVVKRFDFTEQTAAGIGDPSLPPSRWFRERLRPQLERLQLWGIKEVLLEQAAPLIKEIQPDKLVLCVRDLRDVYLSSLDLIGRSLLAFSGGSALRDEAWATERLRADVETLTGLFQRDHLLVRYEAFVGRPEKQDKLRRQLGLPAFGGGGITLHEGGIERGWEADKHGGAITGRSLDRHKKETDGFALAIANAVAAEHRDFLAERGYDAPEADPSGFLRQPPDDRHVVNYSDYKGRAGDLAYARRRARRMLAGNIKDGTRLIDIDGTVPALPILLRGKASVMCVDHAREGPLQYRRNWSSSGLPSLDLFTDASLLTTLEWYDREQIQQLLNALRSASLTVWIAYHCAEDRPRNWPENGMRSHLSRRDWQDLADAMRCRLVAAWAFDEHQSFLKLKPA